MVQPMTRECQWLFLALLFAALNCAAQREPLLDQERRAVAKPVEIVDELLSDNIERRIAVLESIGMPESLRRPPRKPGWVDTTRVKDVRLLIADLDEDAELEAIITFLQEAYATAIVLDGKAGQWYAVARLTCWCKYEPYGLETFIELRHLVDPVQQELIIRDSLGGTGVYWRDLIIYRMRNGTLHEVLRIPEKRRQCSPTVPADVRTCLVTRADISYLRGAASRTVVVATFKGEMPVLAATQNRNWRPYLTEEQCESFVWEESEFRFVVDSEATSRYCEEAEKEEDPL